MRKFFGRMFADLGTSMPWVCASAVTSGMIVVSALASAAYAAADGCGMTSFFALLAVVYAGLAGVCHFVDGIIVERQFEAARKAEEAAEAARQKLMTSVASGWVSPPKTELHGGGGIFEPAIALGVPTVTIPAEQLRMFVAIHEELKALKAEMADAKKVDTVETAAAGPFDSFSLTIGPPVFFEEVAG